MTNEQAKKEMLARTRRILRNYVRRKDSAKSRIQCNKELRESDKIYFSFINEEYNQLK